MRVCAQLAQADVRQQLLNGRVPVAGEVERAEREQDAAAFANVRDRELLDLLAGDVLLLCCDLGTVRGDGLLHGGAPAGQLGSPAAAIVGGEVRNDEFERALELAESLLKNQCKEKRLPNWAGIAAFAVTSIEIT